MKDKKGFTLIELLAIIVILAIIAVITVPIILNIIEDSHKGAALDSAYGFKDSVSSYYVSKLESSENFILDETFQISNGKLGDIEINFSGTRPTSGTLTYENNELVSGCLVVDGYKVEYNNGKFETAGKGECEEILQATPSECFEYELKKEIYVKDVDACITALMSTELYETENDYNYANMLCRGENSLSVKDLRSEVDFLKKYESTDLIALYPDAFELHELDEIEITGYKCGGQATDYDFEKIYSHTNGEYMDVVIPQKIDGKKVTSIYDYAFSTYEIYDEAFSMSDEKKVIINSVTFQNGITKIGYSAFLNNALTRVALPNSLKIIGQEAFEYNQITNVTIPNGMTTIGNYSFSNNEIENITIPNSVTEIGDGAFSSNQLTNIEMTNSVTTIGKRAFSNNQLTSITIPNSVTSIGEYAFYKNQLTSITIPSSITIIEDSTFSNNKLTNIEIPNSVTYMGSSAFASNQLTSVTIPNGITKIERTTFYSNKLTNITIPNSVTSIGNLAFGNNQLTNVTLPNSVTTIGETAFSNNQLTSVTIPNSVTTIETRAFINNPNLTINVIGYSSKPDGWDNLWNWSDYPVNWNYGG